MNYPGFIGGSQTVRSRTANAEQTINFYVESVGGTPKVPSWMPGTPCIHPFANLGNGPIRATFAQDGRAWAVSGASFYEVFASGNATIRGTAVADGRPATISSNGANGHQLFVTSGGIGYIYDLITNAINPVTTNAEPVQMGAFSDGYFLALKRGSNQFNISNLYDGLIWDALDVFQVSTVADQVVTMIENHREIVLLGSQTSSVWGNSGGDPVYEPIGGVKIDQGSAAPFSAVTLDNTVYWLGGNDKGNRVVYRLKGYTPERISDHGVEFALNQYPRVYDAIAWAYQDEGHSFFVLYLPTAPPRNAMGVHWTTWVYDVATGLWHERAVWDETRLRWLPHYGRCHMFAFDKHLIGDRSSGAIYEYSMKYQQDTETVAV
jgi:hypothetical protein